MLCHQKQFYNGMSWRSLALRPRLWVARSSPKCGGPLTLVKLFSKLLARDLMKSAMSRPLSSLGIWEFRTNQGVPTASRRTLFSNLRSFSTWHLLSPSITKHTFAIQFIFTGIFLIVSVQELEGLSGNAGTRLRLENERLKREVSELRKLVSASGAIGSSAEIPGPSRITQLEEELAQAKETIASKWCHF